MQLVSVMCIAFLLGNLHIPVKNYCEMRLTETSEYTIYLRCNERSANWHYVYSDMHFIAHSVYRTTRQSGRKSASVNATSKACSEDGISCHKHAHCASDNLVAQKNGKFLSFEIVISMATNIQFSQQFSKRVYDAHCQNKEIVELMCQIFGGRKVIGCQDNILLRDSKWQKQSGKPEEDQQKNRTWDYVYMKMNEGKRVFKTKLCAASFLPAAYLFGKRRDSQFSLKSEHFL